MTRLLGVVAIILFFISYVKTDYYADQSQLTYSVFASFQSNGAIGQSFPVSDFQNLAGLVVYVQGYNTYGPGELYVSIYTQPSTIEGTLLTTKTIVNPEPDYILVIWDTPLTLNIGTTYYLILDSNNLNYTVYASDGNGFPGIAYSNCSSSTPRALPGSDITFQTVINLPFVQVPSGFPKIGSNSTYIVNNLLLENIDTTIPTINATSSDPNLLLDSNINITFNTGTISLQITPNNSSSGTVYITLAVTSNAGSYTTKFPLLILDSVGIPLISNINNILLSAQTTTSDPIYFSAADLDTPDSNLTITITSSDPSIIDSTIISLLNCDADKSRCAMILHRTQDQTRGSTNLTVTVTDSINKTSFVVFQVTVDDVPVVSRIKDQSVFLDNSTSQIGPLYFNVTDPNHDGSELTVTVTTDDDTFLLPNLITLACTQDKLNCSVTIAVSQTQSAGTTIMTVTGTDPLGSSGSEAFLVTFNSPLTALGACCVSSSVCYDISEATCSDIGGEFLGSTSSCAISACPTNLSPSPSSPASSTDTSTTGTVTPGSLGNATSSVNSNDSSSSGDSAGKIAGIVIGVILGSCICIIIIVSLVFLVVYYVKHRKPGYGVQEDY